MFLMAIIPGIATQTAYAAAGPGPLDPVAAPAVGLFKTLDQVEPRTPIYSLPFTIDQPGSYYLTGNLTAGAANANGITVTASDVTLDLAGFALSGLGGTSGDGVNVSVAVTNVTVRNGTVRGWGGRGVDADTAYNSQLVDIRASHNGNDGMSLAAGGIIMACAATANGQDGIEALSLCTVSGCVATRNSGDGITVSAGSVVTSCVSSGNGDDGIVGGTGSTIRGNTVYTNVGDGIEVITDCQVAENTCDRNGLGAASSAGIHVTGAGNRIERNNVTASDRGLDIDAANNVVADNSVRGNTNNYEFAAGNQLRLLVSQIPQVISWPATVVLAGTLTGIAGSNGITVAANDVTIDLGGHALVGVASSLDGINVSGTRTNVVVRNGSVRSWAGDGVDATSAVNSQLSNLNASRNNGSGLIVGEGSLVSGCSARTNTVDGIRTSGGCRVTDCTSSRNAGDGFETGTGSSLAGCAAFDNVGVGINASISCAINNCSAYSNTGIGIESASGSTIQQCSVYLNTGNGISVDNGSLVSGCSVRLNTSNGIRANSQCRVENNDCAGNTLAQIIVSSTANRIDGNHCTGGQRGVQANPAIDNLIIRNSSQGATVAAYDIVAGNHSGGVIASPGVGFASTQPWANFSF